MIESERGQGPSDEPAERGEGSASDEPHGGRSRRPSPTIKYGVGAMVLAVLCFSSSSSVVKLADTAGTTVAFWRMLIAALLWHAFLRVRRQRISAAQWRRAIIPGILFGFNIALFFAAVTHTSIAHAEFIGSMSPLVLVPVGAIVFSEAIPWRALVWGLVAFVGVALVLFNSPPRGAANAKGDLIMIVAVGTWTGYMTTTRRLRGDMDVARFMAAITPIGWLTLIPLVIAQGDVLDVPAKGWAYIVVLAVLTGTAAHGLVVFSQHHLPMGTISIMQVAQPALAVGCAKLLLDEDLRAIQALGGGLVIVGLMLFVWVAQVRDRRQVVVELPPE